MPIAAGQVIEDPGSAFVGHLVGVPMLILNLTLKNPLETKLDITNLSMDLVDPQGKVLPLLFQDWLANGNNIPQAPVPVFPLIPKVTWPVQCRFGGANGELARLTQLATAEFAAGNMRAEPGSVHYSKTLADDCRRVMNDNFMWAPGTWAVHLHCSAGGDAIERVFSFTLTAEHILGLRNIAKYFEGGYGLNAVMQPFWDHKDGHSYVQLALH